ncbi:MAG: glycoside hydrolase family 3 protein [Mediterranea sp.]|nr:glycoside hydrolase family 3 protein [Mediterranea sp.]
MTKPLSLSFLLTVFFCLQAKAQHEPLLLYKVLQEDSCRQWVDSVFNKMTLEEKVGQLFVYTITPVDTKRNRALLREVVRDRKAGGLLFSQGVPEIQAILTNHAQEIAKIPLMITLDGEWGLSMRLKDTPVYPRNTVLGCISDEQLIYDYGREVARQCRELGIHVNFAPVADVNTNPANPVINSRSFGQDPKLVSDNVILYAAGLESGGILSVAKHFPGHGDTDTDSHHELPLLNFTRERLDSIELYPFKQAIQAGLGGIMAGHLEVPALEPQKGLPASLSPHIVQHLLREELGFKGLVFTDALAMKGVAGTQHPSLAAIKAGNDMVLVARNIKEEIEAVIQAIEDGCLDEETINRKCKKILTCKYALGTAHPKKIRLSGLSQRINTAYAHDLGNRLNEAAVTLAGNKSDALPLHQSIRKIAVINAGTPEKNAAFEQALEKHLAVEHIQLDPDMPDDARKQLDDVLPDCERIVVCLSDEQSASAVEVFLAGLPAEAPLIYVFFIPQKHAAALETALAKAAAVIFAHTDEENTQEHTAKILLGQATVNGRLSTSIGNLFKTGDGVTLQK